jgi:long-chain acyl-CoA synthetase
MYRDPILEAFDRQRQRHPDRVLVASPSRAATVADVDALAGVADEHLAAAGLAPGSMVGLAAPDGPAFLASFVALRRRGLVPVLLESKAPPAERDRVADGLGCAWTLTCGSRWPRSFADWQLSGRGPRVRPEPALRLDPGTAAVKLTSGSTGRPRGVLTPAAALFADDAALARTMGLSDDERILGAIPMSHSYGLSSVAMPALARGSLVIMPEEGSGPFGPLRAAHALGATFFPTVPAFLRAVLASDRPPCLPESLRLTISAGAPLPPATARRFREVHGRPVHVFYGSSETGGICFDREGDAGERGSVGTPVDGVTIHLLPLEAADGCSADVQRRDLELRDRACGVVTIESEAVAAGYLPAEPERLSGGRFRSGDIARWQDETGGELVLSGRTDDLINVRGKKVNPREVEGVLAAMPGVREVLALGSADAGRAEPTLRVVVACDPGRLSPDQVLAWCRARLTEHKVPRSVVLVTELPRNARGKIDRQAARALRPRRPGRELRSGSTHP